MSKSHSSVWRKCRICTNMWGHNLTRTLSLSLLFCFVKASYDKKAGPLLKWDFGHKMIKFITYRLISFY